MTSLLHVARILRKEGEQLQFEDLYIFCGRGASALVTVGVFLSAHITHRTHTQCLHDRSYVHIKLEEIGVISLYQDIAALNHISTFDIALNQSGSSPCDSSELSSLHVGKSRNLLCCFKYNNSEIIVISLLSCVYKIQDPLFLRGVVLQRLQSTVVHCSVCEYFLCSQVVYITLHSLLHRLDEEEKKVYKPT